MLPNSQYYRAIHFDELPMDFTVFDAVTERVCRFKHCVIHKDYIMEYTTHVSERRSVCCFSWGSFLHFQSSKANKNVCFNKLKYNFEIIINCGDTTKENDPNLYVIFIPLALSEC